MQAILPPSGRLIGVDYGTVRIGISVCDPDRIIASPLEIYVRKNEKKDAEYFKTLVEQERIVGFVIGLPLHLSGELSPKAQEALRFGKWLEELTGLPIDFIDERFTSVEAEGFLREAMLTRKKRKKRLDAVAAQILLANFLERGCIGTHHCRSLDD